MIPTTALAVLACVTLAVTLWWGYEVTVRPDTRGGMRPFDRAMASPATALGGWVGDASVVCPHCDAENRVGDAHCAGCSAQLSPEWPVE